ncbi:MAG: 16S rRNA (uracil(1498)-N(3))-methyltransferase [Planctomycetota bacterium]|nr:MAG: 16S rRNA (uracil(1498)-N(3))-methyltransferase [Planctomycetota bacterium]REK45841.1 MAG: 16S rRNA (uracil(1498)-N(3))-methyltransferase [Planctomycetota bacterium]
MSRRFFCTEPLSQSQVRLTDSEAHHLIHVMRAQVGDEVVLFDGSGTEAAARVAELGRTDAVLAVLSRDQVDRELPFRLTLAVALPKGDRQKWLVEKAVELGVARLLPLKTKRGVAQPVTSAIERLRRSVIEAAKQCGRNRLMEIGEPVEVVDLFSEWAAEDLALVAHPESDGAAATAPWTGPAVTLGEVSSQRGSDGHVVVAIGPEGGFADEELAAAAEAAWRRLDLGPRILRVETAALTVAAALASVSHSAH